MHHKWKSLWVACVGLMSTAVYAHTGSKYNLPVGVTPISRDIHQLHMTIFWICVAIGVVVFGVLTYALVKHRKSKGAVPAEFHENTKLEILWAIIPFLILIVMAIPATKTLMRMDDTSKADVTVMITGYQWKWQYDYLDEGISFFSNLSTPQDQRDNKAPKGQWYLLEVDHPLVVPVNEKIRFLVTANDVIHSWWVPDLGVKRDAIPGFIHESWAVIEKPGIYRGQCAELCGMGHGFMPIVVEAVSQEDYQKWLDKQHEQQKAAAAASVKTWTKAELMKEGEEKYDTICAVCHQKDGSGNPPVFPALHGDGIVTGPADKHIHTVLHGVPGTAMQAFGPQLSDAEIAAIITYERNAWGNDDTSKGDKDRQLVIQPADVAAERKK